jgi:hypothetical protein
MSATKVSLNLPFYSRFTQDDWPKLIALKSRVAEDLTAWLAPVCTCLQPRAFDLIPELICFGAPWNRAEELMTGARFSAWVSWLDYLLDAVEGRTPEYLRELHDAVEAGLNCRRAPKKELEPLAHSLSELCEHMSRSPAANFLPTFKEVLIREVEACRRLFEMRAAVVRGGQAPTVDEFLAESSWSIFFISCSLALLIGLGTPIPDRYRPRVMDALMAASRAVRLANDLQTRSKDVAEGTLNILDCGLSAEQVRARIQREMDDFDGLMVNLRREVTSSRTMEALQNKAHLARDCFEVVDMLAGPVLPGRSI